MTSKEYIHRDIIENCIDGNNRARNELYKLYSRAMFNICYRMAGNREDAEDMLQEAFTRAFLKIHTFRFDSEFGAWLKRIVVNTCINALNKRKVEITYFDELSRYEQPEEEDNPDIVYKTQDILNAMKELPRGGRLIFSLYLLEGYDHQEISQILNITESTSKSQFMRAKNRIIQILKEQKK